MSDPEKKKAYWSANLRLVGVLLVIWFVASFGCSILFVDALDNIRFGGFKLGFWMAQQGSMFVFVVIIFVYVQRMKKLDRKFEVHED